MATRISYLFALTTQVTDRESATEHSAGWSESWWRDGTTASDAPQIAALAQKRAILLPAQASIIGFRLSVYTLAGNKILPAGSKTGKFLYPGSAGYVTDLPQVSLEMSGTTGGGTNTSRFVLRGMPDIMMVGGEYQPQRSYKGYVTQFGHKLVDDGWNFLGRDLSLPTARVTSIVAGVMKTNVAMGLAAGDWVRLLRVFDEDGKSVQGSFRVSSIVDATTVVLAGMDAEVIVEDSGLARKDVLKLCPFTSVEPSRAVSRKVGRPFESYRGRRSKR